MKLTEDQRNKIFKIYQEYPRKDHLKKITIGYDFIKIAEEYLKVIKPFLQFIEERDPNLKDVFKVFLNNSNFNNKLPEHLNELQREVEYGKGYIRESVKKIISSRLQEFNELHGLILYLVSKDHEKSKDVSLERFEFETKKPEVKKKEKKHVIKPRTGH